MKVRVERLRRGSRKPEISYVEARTPGKRQGVSRAEQGVPPSDASYDGEIASNLRLPWRLNRGHKQGA